MRTAELFARLDPARRLLIAGAGGGFDVYAGLPLMVELLEGGKEVFLANLSFTHLHIGDPDAWLAPHVAAVGADTTGPDEYFPERTLARWLRANGFRDVVYAFPHSVGVQSLRSAYRSLIKHLELDAIVLVDGGTDILLRGDESGLGTPEEDMTSLAAAAALSEVPIKLVVSLGFGIDAYHGVNHVQVLENIAELDQDGGFLGAFSIPSRSRAAQLYCDAVAHAQDATPRRPSIVNGQIAAALAGKHGDVHVSTRTGGSTLFVNPLMGMYFAFDLLAVARRNLYLDRIEDTAQMRQVSRAIDEFRHGLASSRQPRAFPH
jgi:hypothetical protein